MKQELVQTRSGCAKTASWRSRTMYFVKILSVFAILLAWNLLPPSFSLLPSRFTSHESKSQERPKKEWSWTEIKPSRGLHWSSCYDDFECARLDVPLDWLDPTENDRVVLAIIKLPATDLNNYKGPVFTNPGGPGGSGVYALRDRGKALQKIVGTNHDIIGFDPRGIGATTPPVNCWDSKDREKLWSFQEVGVIDSHPGVLFDAFARSVAHSGLCTAKRGTNLTEKRGKSDILEFVSTTSVARDMLEILNELGLERLRYWGFSYGTMLGGTFAAMYPDRIERLVSDGNVDYVEWTTCSHLNALHDTDKVMDAFYRLCHKAGPSGCDFYSSKPSEIEARLDRLLEKLRIHPVIVPATQNNADLPELITYSSLKRFISAALYRPILLFPPLAKVLAALQVGDGVTFLDVITAQGMREPFSCDCNSCEANPKPPVESESYDDAFKAIMCTDGGGMNETVEEFENYADHIMKQSKAAGAVNVLFRIGCAGWTTKAKWAFTGPFTANTSHPILYIANKADNVTPLRSAQQNSKGFRDSVILIQNSYGHTTLSAPSICTAKHIRAYFQDGTLPPPNTECEADIEPFQVIHNPVQTEGEYLELWSGLQDLMQLDRSRGYMGS